MYSALGIAIIKRPTKRLSKKLSCERDIARAPESAENRAELLFGKLK